MSFIFLSVLASSLANLKIPNLSICYILPFFQWTFPCWQPLSLCPSLSLSFGVAKIVFFLYAHTMPHFFLKFFFICIISLIVSVLFFRPDIFFLVFPHFFRPSRPGGLENFADFWKNHAKIDSGQFLKQPKIMLFSCNQLI